MNVGHRLLGNRLYLLLLAGVMFSHLATYLINPIFPVYLENVRGFGLGQIGLILGAGSFAFQLGSLLGGVLSDQRGRRTVMVAGAVLQGAAMFGYGFSQAFAAFLVYSTVNGIGLGMYAPTVKAMIAGAVGAKNRTTAFSGRGIAANLGIIIAGLSITLLALGTERRIFFYAAALLLALALFFLLTLPHDRAAKASSRPSGWKEYKTILTHRSFLLFSAVSLLIWALYAQFAFILPLRGEYVLGSTSQIGLIWTINSLVLVLVQGPVSRLVLERINPSYSLFIATLLIGLGISALGLANGFFTLSLVAIVFITGEMMLMPIWDSLVGHFAKPELLGAYYGFSNVVTAVASALGTTAGGSLVERLGGVGSQLTWIGYALTSLLFLCIVGLFVYYAKDRHGDGRRQMIENARSKWNVREEKVR